MTDQGSRPSSPDGIESHPPARAPRVLVVDDQTLVRQGIRTLLQLGGIDIVAEASDGAQGLEAVQTHAPDVVLLDLRMPVYDGLWLLDALGAAEYEAAPAVLVLTTFDDDTLVLDALRKGARGYLLKDVTVDQLSRAVHTLADGGTLIAPSITDRLLTAIRAAPAPVGTHDVPVPSLTARELEILRLIAAGYPNRDIASLMHLAEGTVKNHISTVLTKLGARDRTNAVLKALREGLLD